MRGLTGELPHYPNAACVGKPVVWWFPNEFRDRDNRTVDLYTDARRVCMTCPHVAECAVRGSNEQYGMWGGLSPRDRLRIQRSKDYEASVTKTNRAVFELLDELDVTWFRKVSGRVRVDRRRRGA